MNTSVTLKAVDKQGRQLTATYMPERGMNLVSYKCGSIEVIDQSTKDLFEERNAGLGALIGPHFHHRNKKTIPPLTDKSAFPHIARLKGVVDPFSHGVSRYAPWQYKAEENSIRAKLTGKDVWNGITLEEIEGQDFTLEYSATLTEEGLQIHYSVTSSGDSVVGLHYYYAMPKGSAIIRSHVKDQAIVEGKLQPIPEEWGYTAATHSLVYPVAGNTDFTFHPYPDPLKGNIIMDTGDYIVRVHYECCCEENCWQCYHPEGSSFVCIEPISAQDPRHVNLTASSIAVLIEIV